MRVKQVNHPMELPLERDSPRRGRCLTRACS
jgi:hypothetical protein